MITFRFLTFSLCVFFSCFAKADLGLSLLASVAVHAGVLAISLDKPSSTPSSDLDAMAGLQPKAPVVNPPTASNPTGRINVALTPNNPAHQGQKINIQLQPGEKLPDPLSDTVPPVAMPGDSLYCSRSPWGKTICGPTAESMADGFVGTHYIDAVRGNITITKLSSDKYTYCYGDASPQCPNYEQLRFNNVEVTILTSPMCPEGYEQSGASCIKELPDGTLDIILQDDLFTFRGKDPDSDSPDTFKPLIKDGGQTVQLSGRDPVTNTPKTITVSHDSSTQNTTIRVDTQINGPTGSHVDTTTAVVGPSGDITSSSSNSQPGTLNNPSGPGSGDGTPGSGGSGTSPGSTITPGDGLVFPSDYARRGEAEKAADKITQRIDDIFKDVSPPDDLEEPDSSEMRDLFFKNTFNDLLGWRLPSHQSQCPKPRVTLFGQDHVIDSHCTIANEHFHVLSRFMMVVWVVIALFIVLRA